MKKTVGAFLIISLTSCQLAAVKEPVLSSYSLTSAPVVAVANDHAPVYASESQHQTLLLTTMLANPGYQTEKMIYSYSNEPYKLMSYVNSQWVAPPAQMLLPQLATAIRQKHVYKAVVIQPYQGASNVVLSTRLLYLRQVFQPQSLRSSVQGAIDVTLINSRTHQVMWSGEFSKTVADAGSGPDTGVKAMNRCVRNIIDEAAAAVSINVEGKTEK